MKTKEELLTAMSQYEYTTQKELADQIGESASNLSRLLSKYDLKVEFEINKSTPKETTQKETNHNYNQFFAKCREIGRELWEEFLEQGGEIHPDKRIYDYGTYIELNAGATQEAKEAIRIAVAAHTPYDNFSEQEQTRIGMLLYRVKCIKRGGTH